MEIHVVGPALVELDVGALRAYRFQRGAELESANCGAGEEGSEDEVGAGGDDNSLEFFGGQAVGQDEAGPAVRGGLGLCAIGLYVFSGGWQLAWVEDV